MLDVERSIQLAHGEWGWTCFTFGFCLQFAFFIFPFFPWVSFLSMLSARKIWHTVTRFSEVLFLAFVFARGDLCGLQEDTA